jgi:ABC-type bacteriocin/lantibiotic exporter with double-glycine peptidase domain
MNKSTLVKLLCGLYEPDEGKIQRGGYFHGAQESAVRSALCQAFSI